MDKYQETIQTWNKIAKLYEEKFMHLDLYNASYDVFCHSVTLNKPKILEIGCGPGNITRYLLSKRPDFDIMGIDVAPNMVELARKNNSLARFAVMDCRDIGKVEEQFDGIICGFCLPYIDQESCIQLLIDAYNLINQGGVIYISFVEGSPEKSGFLSGSTGDRTYFYYHELDVIVSVMEHIGFSELELIKVEYEKSGGDMEWHTVVLGRKIT